MTRRSLPVVLLSLPAGVAIWSGWVALGTLCGFGKVQPLPGVLDGFWIDTRITLPVGMETYAAYALRVWITTPTGTARRFAKASAITALVLGAGGQVAYHLMAASGMTTAPWPVVAVVATLPVAVLGMGAALAHLQAHQPCATPTDVARVDVAVSPGAAAVSAPVAGPGTTSTLGWPDRTDRTDTTPFSQVNGPEFRQVPPDRTPGGPDRTPRRAPAGAGSASAVGARVLALTVEHPGWTQARIAEEVGCSVRTVRRHQQQATATPPAGWVPAQVVTPVPAEDTTKAEEPIELEEEAA
jgi:DNA-binding CsgD family transcriptional regulator